MEVIISLENISASRLIDLPSVNTMYVLYATVLLIILENTVIIIALLFHHPSMKWVQVFKNKGQTLL